MESKVKTLGVYGMPTQSSGATGVEVVESTIEHDMEEMAFFFKNNLERKW